MKPRSPTRWERINVPRSMILAILSRPCEILMLSTTVSMLGKVLRTLSEARPVSYGVYFLGSNVSVCAMPPAIQSRITESARGSILGPAKRRASLPVKAASVAPTEARMKSRRELLNILKLRVHDQTPDQVFQAALRDLSISY